MSSELWLILGMAAVTLIPRILPALLPPDFRLPPMAANWLSQVPYAALGALIFPGVLTAVPGGQWVGGLAAVAATIAGFLRAPAYVAALVAVLVVVAVALAQG